MKKLILIAAVLFSACTVSKEHKPDPRSQRYCIVVDEVKVRGKRAIIKPKCQHTEPHGKKVHRIYWYRYPTPNVFPGDTVDVCEKEILDGPRF